MAVTNTGAGSCFYGAQDTDGEYRIIYRIIDLGRMTRLVERLTYKPCWRFEVLSHPWMATGQPCPTLLVHAVVEDSNGWGPDHDWNKHIPEMVLTHSFPVPDVFWSPTEWTDEDFYGFVLASILYVERHEAKEFFKVDGVRFQDPHRDHNKHLYE